MLGAALLMATMPFSSAPTPTLASVDHQVSDHTAGDANQVITTTGTNLATGTALTLGGVACTNLVWASTTVQFRVPALSAGLHDLVVTLSGGGTCTLANAIEAWRPTDSATNLQGWWRGDLGVTQAAGTCSVWTDQSGNSRTIVAAPFAEPSVNASGMNGQQTLDVNSASMQLSTALAMSNFITVSASTVVVACAPHQYTANFSNSYDNYGILGGNGGGSYFGLLTKTGPVAIAYIWDGAEKHDNTSFTGAIDAPLIMSHVHSGGGLSVSANGSVGAGAASGDVGNVSAPFVTSSTSGSCKYAEIAIWNIDVGSTILAKCQKYMNYRYRAY